MSSSLRDQLLKAGLVTEKQVKEAEKQARKPPPRKLPKSARNQQKRSAAEKAQAEKAERDRELNRRQAEKAEARARAAQVKQIVDQHRVPPAGDDGEPFHFQDGAHIKRVYVTADQRRQLVDGALVIVRYGRSFALIPQAVVGKVKERDPDAIVDLSAATSARSDEVDDAYKGFEVPDDLMW